MVRAGSPTIPPSTLENKDVDRCSVLESGLHPSHVVINAWRIPVKPLSDSQRNSVVTALKDAIGSDNIWLTALSRKKQRRQERNIAFLPENPFISACFSMCTMLRSIPPLLSLPGKDARVDLLLASLSLFQIQSS